MTNLNPPPIPYTELEIFKARLAYAMRLLADDFHIQNLWRRNEKSEAELEKNATEFFAKLHDCSDETGDDPETIDAWMERITPNWHYFEEALSEPHLGDCVAFPSPCSRCHAEDYLNKGSTVTWGKHEGSAALYALSNLKKDTHD